MAPTFDVNAPQVTELISFLRKRGTVVDGTFNVWQARSKPLADGMDVVVGPTIAWLPPLMRRGFRPGPPDTPMAAARGSGQHELSAPVEASI